MRRAFHRVLGVGPQDYRARFKSTAKELIGGVQFGRKRGEYVNVETYARREDETVLVSFRRKIMKPLITPWRQRIYTRGKDPVSLSCMSFESAVNVSVALNDDRVITGEEKKGIREQIEQAVEKLDIEVLLDPNMPHLGGMEVLARIKRDLSRNLHPMTPVKAA